MGIKYNNLISYFILLKHFLNALLPQYTSKTCIKHIQVFFTTLYECVPDRIIKISLAWLPRAHCIYKTRSSDPSHFANLSYFLETKCCKAQQLILSDCWVVHLCSSIACNCTLNFMLNRSKHRVYCHTICVKYGLQYDI